MSKKNLIPRDEQLRIELLKKQNAELKHQISQLEQDVHQLNLQFQSHLRTHFFKVWQIYKHLAHVFRIKQSDV